MTRPFARTFLAGNALAGSVDDELELDFTTGLPVDAAECADDERLDTPADRVAS